MYKVCVLLTCFALLACDFVNKEQAKNTSVTDGKLVLGIVPIKNGANGDIQRYRLLVCKRLPKYNAKMFTDKSICRSGLQTKDGREVDLTGTKLANPALAHLDVEKAAEVRKLGFSPIDLSNQVANKRHAKVGVVLMGILTVGSIALTKVIAGDKLGRLAVLLSGAVAASSGLLTLYFAKEAGADVDTEGRVLPRVQSRACSTSGGLFPKYCAPVFNRADTITSEQWNNINSQDFSDAESLEHSEDVRLILTAMAKTFQLKINEDSLRL